MRRQSSGGTLACLMLTCVFGATLLLSLVTGAGVYRRVEDRVEESSRTRVSLSYIAAKIHACDRAGMVETGSFGEGGAVFLYEEYDGFVYETILYVYDGNLMEMLCGKGEEMPPEFGEAVSPAQSLIVTEAREGLLWLSLREADGQVSSAAVYIRSVG